MVAVLPRTVLKELYCIVFSCIKAGNTECVLFIAECHSTLYAPQTNRRLQWKHLDVLSAVHDFDSWNPNHYIPCNQQWIPTTLLWMFLNFCGCTKSFLGPRVPLGMCLVIPVQFFHQTKPGGPVFSGINISYTRKFCIQFSSCFSLHIAYNVPLFSIQVFWPIMCRFENSCLQTTYMCYFQSFHLLCSEYACCFSCVHSNVKFYHLSDLC